MSLSIPNTCRIDTFMSGRPAFSCTAAVIAPPWPRDPPETRFRFDVTVLLMVVNLADAGQAKNPAGANNTINYINKIVSRGPVRKAGLGCFSGHSGTPRSGGPGIHTPRRRGLLIPGSPPMPFGHGRTPRNDRPHVN